MVKENVAAVAHLVATPFGGDNVDLATLAVGDGAITKIDGEKLAVSRSESGALRAVSANCTHMGCAGGNHVDQTWDCPCHGSRFTPDGSVVRGPAVHALAPRTLPLPEQVSVRGTTPLRQHRVDQGSRSTLMRGAWRHRRAAALRHLSLSTPADPDVREEYEH
jgi:nitrite reductase/ring-hydroxylating ferredoxin subunit